MTSDALILEIYNEMKRSVAEGNALIYATKIATRIEGSREPARREEIEEAPRQPTTQPRPVVRNPGNTDGVRVRSDL